MEAISNFFYWLFNDRTGVICLVLGGIVLFIIIAFILEKKTKQIYFNHEKTDDDWDFFDDEDGWSEFEDDNK